ncbi:hypothetical protein BDQ17DRAFT_1355005 [Cyathus striatus]|nr:hypothetical protein BDQ17DRAFT_1355005 [Cyathus striatus]
MQSFTLLLSFAVGLAAANLLSARQSSFPACATTCITNADTGGCSTSNMRCLCLNQVFIDSIVDCSDSTCPAVEDKKESRAVIKDICEQVGVSLDI